MLENTWREKLKSGPLTGVYAYLRRVKRKLLREPLAGVVPMPTEPWSVGAHFSLLKQHPDHGRLYFSLAIAYLDRNDQGDLAKARACLRTAAALNFESPERIWLYEALISVRAGHASPALDKVRRILAYEWTDEEIQLLSELGPLHGITESCISRSDADVHLEIEGARSVLVIDDDLATTAGLAPSADYFLAAPSVTGVGMADLAPMGRTFEVGIMPVTGPSSTMPVSRLCDRWVTVDFADLAVR